MNTKKREPVRLTTAEQAAVVQLSIQIDDLLDHYAQDQFRRAGRYPPSRGLMRRVSEVIWQATRAIAKTTTYSLPLYDANGNFTLNRDPRADCTREPRRAKKAA